MAAEQAVDAGVRIMRSGRSHIGAVVAKGDRNFATAVDFRIESVIKASLAEAAPGIAFLSEEGGGDIGSETSVTIRVIRSTSEGTEAIV